MSGEKSLRVTKKHAHLKALTGLRIIAAVWVFVHHFDDVIIGLMPGLSFMDPLFHQGWRGVDLFFMLSGFILAYQYMDRFSPGVRRKEYLHFIRARIARIYPVHFLTLHTSVLLFTGAALLGVPVQSGLSDNTFWTYLQNLFLVQAWWGHPLSWNGVSWSVSAEWFAYLLFPFAALAIYRVRSRLLGSIIGAASLVVFTVAYQSVNSSATVSTDGDLFRIAGSFIAGCCLFKIYALTPQLGRFWSYAPAAALLLVIGLSYLPAETSVLMLPVFGILILGLARGTDGISQLLSTKFMVHGGAISFSFYMVHQQVLTVVRSVVPESLYGGGMWPIGALVILGTLGFVYLAAHLVFLFVEEPCRKRIRGGRRTEEASKPSENLDAKREQEPAI
ncbi:acyltransferase [Arthrobacter sp. D3-18]